MDIAPHGRDALHYQRHQRAQGGEALGVEDVVHLRGVESRLIVMYYYI
jgi:hypothetical protein